MSSLLTTPASSISARTAGLAGSTPLFHAAWLFAAGIAVARVVWLSPGWLLIAIASLGLLALIAAFHALRIAWLPVAVLWCLLGAWCAEMQPQPAPATNLLALSDNLARTVEGVVVDAGPMQQETDESADDAVSEGSTQRIDLQVSSIEVATDSVDEQQPVQGRVRITVRWPMDAASVAPLRCGQTVQLVTQLLPPAVYRDPGVWSRRDYLLDQGVTATGSAPVRNITALARPVGNLLPCRMRSLQHGLSARMMQLSAHMQSLPPALRLTPDDSIMLSAITTGDRTFLTHALRVGFERTGSFHMLVVSGLHLAIVAGFFFWLLRRLRVLQAPATLLALAASCAYALFTGFGAPVQRSLWMVAVYLLGRLLYREASALNTLGFASLCLLAVNPRGLFDAGLQMTLLAVLVIAGVAAPLLEATLRPYTTATRDLDIVAIDVKLAPALAQFRVVLRIIAARLQRAASPRIAWRVFPWLVRTLLFAVEAFIVSCAVELAMTLPMAIDFHRITVFALPVNILILPLLTLLLPAALLTLVTLLAWPAAAVVPAILAGGVLHLSVALVRLFGSLSLGDLRIPTPLPSQAALFCILLGISIALAQFAIRTRHRRLHTAAWVALFLAAIATVFPRPVKHPNNALFIEALDVGQGDSILLISPEGKTMLVDGGGFGGGPHPIAQNFDVGEDVVSPALWARGIRHLDVVALTHAHSDHIGGLPAVLRNFHPDELWVGNNPQVADYLNLLQEATVLHIRVRPLHAGDAVSLGAAQIHVLAPATDYMPGPQPANNDSLVLHVAYGATSALLEGDAEAPVEQAMLSEQGLQSTLLKVGHHGSATSTTPQFLARVAPQWAVISCGLHNRYGHPREEVLSALQSAGARTYSTDINGAACFTLTGSAVLPDPFCGEDHEP
ncbi:MAG: ComEC/Rec2 family competence protein [Acidobacteriota bacterium]|nr:ComEC/Rec2 family competence protein [Acidobacteriota bacterium]